MSLGAYITIIAVAAVFLLFIVPAAVLSYILYRALLIRTSKEKWGRVCSIPDDEEYVRMYDIGMEWGGKYSGYKEDVSITSDGLKLAGEYFDFGFDKAVIIIPGRMEACNYSYYFSEPFRLGGYNILAIDNRSHGLSEGDRCFLGYKEYRDIINWGRFLHDEKGVSSVKLLGICIGASVALFACTAKECPDYIDGMVAEGMYTTFAESFKNHMIDDRHPIFPLYYAAMIQIRLFSGANVVTDGPIYRMDKMKKPILFLHSKEDVYSLPDKALVLYDKCSCEKKLVWFDKGAHSRIRINNTKEYDDAVIEFLTHGISHEEEAV